jgi:hypothetical protein
MYKFRYYHIEKKMQFHYKDKLVNYANKRYLN